MTPYRDAAENYPAEPYSKSEYHRQSHSSHYRPSPSLPKFATPDPQKTVWSSAPQPILARQAAASTGVQPRPIPQPSAPQTRPRRSGRPGGYVVAGGSVMLALMAFLLPKQLSPQAPPKADVCQQEVQAQSVLSRPELTQLLSVPERSSKEAVRQVIAEPYCLMAPIEVSQGVAAEREAYPLAFDPQTWLVVLYEGDEYAGYDFSFRR